MILVFLFTFFLAAVSSLMYFTIRYGIGSVPTSFSVKKAVQEILPPNALSPIFELGSGFGGMAFALAKHYPNCQVIAIEISFFPLWYAHLKQYFMAVPNLTFIRADFFEVDLADAKMIYCYLYPQAMEKLEQKIKKECLFKLILITHTFAYPHLLPLKKVIASDLYHTPVYLYEFYKKL